MFVGLVVGGGAAATVLITVVPVPDFGGQSGDQNGSNLEPTPTADSAEPTETRTTSGTPTDSGNQAETTEDRTTAPTDLSDPPGLPPTNRSLPGRTLVDTSFEPWDRSEWQVSQRGDDGGSVGTVEGRLGLRVYKCYRVAVTRNLGSHDGTLYLSYAWSNAADQWYEYTRFRLLNRSGGRIDYEVLNGAPVKSPDRGETKVNATTVRANVSGEVRIRFLIEPSQYCGRGNHENTHLWVDDLLVTVVEDE